ncbi:MAG: TrkA family potassium uptake protein [Anaerolineae bacterium]|nr:TrkA family potassium uptake protein [Anaerolineae bacterium]
MPVEILPIIYIPKREPSWRRNLRAIWRDSSALWREFRRPILVFVVTTILGGFIYGELHDAAGLTPPIAMIDRPYTIVQLMILEAPVEYETTPDVWYLIIWWYLLPIIFVFIVGNGAADFVRLFFNRDERRDAWREAVASTYRNHIIILGVGHVGRRVVRVLHDLMGVDVVAIEQSPSPDLEAFLKERRIPLIRGDGSQKLTLEKAGLQHAEAFVACTGNDHTNLDAIMRARSMNNHIRIVARIWDDQFNTQIKEFMRVQSVISSSNISAPVFAGLALGVELTQTLHISGVEYSTMRLTVNQGFFMDGKTVGDMQEEQDIDIVLHVEKGHSADVKPSRSALINVGDILVIFAQHEKVLQIAARNRLLR